MVYVEESFVDDLVNNINKLEDELDEKDEELEECVKKLTIVKNKYEEALKKIQKFEDEICKEEKEEGKKKGTGKEPDILWENKCYMNVGGRRRLVQLYRIKGQEQTLRYMTIA